MCNTLCKKHVIFFRSLSGNGIARWFLILTVICENVVAHEAPYQQATTTTILELNQLPSLVFCDWYGQLHFHRNDSLRLYHLIWNRHWDLLGSDHCRSHLVQCHSPHQSNKVKDCIHLFSRWSISPVSGFHQLSPVQ